MQPQSVSIDVLQEKYAKGDESSIEAVQSRVARALAGVEQDAGHWERRFYQAMQAGFIPAGRIMSAAGASIEATLINCFVQPVGDSVSEYRDGKPGIYPALNQSAETMRRGGGVGYDFSRIRPKGALVKGTASRASGPVSYMRVFDRSCETVESAGARRGAQMGVLRVDHPDVEEFVAAKAERGELTNFNVSVGVTDEFMRAVQDDRGFDLVHQAEPGPEQKQQGAHQRDDGVWVYRRIRARDLWDEIMASTYDHAEPGVLFLDRINAENNLYYCERIESTNPCVTADTWVHTDQGPRQVQELLGQPFSARINGQDHASSAAGFFATGTKPVLQLVTHEGYQLRLTADHPVRKVTAKTRWRLDWNWTPVGKLQPGDEVLLHDHGAASDWPGRYSFEQGYLLGLLLGDGTLKQDKAIISVWPQQATGSGAASDPRARGIMQAALAAARTLPHRGDFQGWTAIPERGEYRLTTGALKQLAGELGMRPGAQTITPEAETTSADFHRGLLRGLFDADGSVQGSQQKGVSVRLSQSDDACLLAVQRMLLRLGIRTTLYRQRRPAQQRRLPDGQGGSRDYSCRAQHELVISGANLIAFAEQVGFADPDKAARLQASLGQYQRALNRERFTATVAALTPAGEATVYDVQIPGINAFDANGLYVHNCGEQPLPDYGACCLGSIDLTRFVQQPFTAGSAFDFDAFGNVVTTAVRMLDNVLEVTHWPLPEQSREAHDKRRVGLGYTGLGDALIMLGLRYNTEAAREMAARISERLRDSAYRASVELAREKGPFPLLDVEAYLNAGFLHRLPADIRDAITRFGIRNSHLTSIAPTGTISLAFADNASNGIEPPFAFSYTRRKREADGSLREYIVEDHAHRVFRENGGDIEQLPEAFISALQISALDHARMVTAVVPYIDSAVSKTVNVPADYEYADFKDLYLEAWHSGAKGLATFRPNAITGSVLSETSDSTKATPAEGKLDESDPDRRMRLKEIPTPPLASLRWRKRPDLPAGNPAWAYMVSHPHGHHFAVFIGHVENGERHPFEVWVNGAEQPRGLGALAKSLSMDMRSQDRAWLQTKLESLATINGDDTFDYAMPPTGEPMRMPSLVACFARLVLLRCNELGAFAQAGDTPLLEALMSAKEPRTSPDGTLSWTVDIRNPATGDDFVMGLKELTLPDGQRRPYSVWLAGEYPRTLDGLCRSLSFDMRVVDPAWIGGKLRQLLNYPEPRGDFLARVPGQATQANYPSTIGYMAQLMIHRYAMLGILDEEGLPMEPMGAVDTESEPEADNVIPLRHAGALEVQPGRRCEHCGNYAVIKIDGCDFCTACGEKGACG